MRPTPITPKSVSMLTALRCHKKSNKWLGETISAHIHFTFNGCSCWVELEPLPLGQGPRRGREQKWRWGATYLHTISKHPFQQHSITLVLTKNLNRHKGIPPWVASLLFCRSFASLPNRRLKCQFKLVFFFFWMIFGLEENYLFSDCSNQETCSWTCRTDQCNQFLCYSPFTEILVPSFYQLSITQWNHLDVQWIILS